MEVIALLKELIACRSVTPAAGGSLALLGGLLEKAGFSLQLLPAGGVENLYAYKGAQTSLLFAGHIDVVPPGELQQWQTDPFVAVEQDGRLFGRGAVDMKSGVAAMVAAACAAPQDGVGIFLTSDEEGPAKHGTRHFTEWWGAQGKPPIPYCIVGEPTCERVFGDAIKVGRRGSLTGRLCLRGQQGHAAYAYRVDNPAHHLAHALHRLVERWQENIARQAQGEMVTTFQVVDIQSGVGANNVTPPQATAVFNFRYAPPHTAEQLQQEVAAVLDGIAAGKWQCEWENSAQPYALPQDSELAAVLREVVHAHSGQTAAYTTSGGVSDGRFLRHICEQMAEFGVVNATLHEPNENVCIADVRQLAQVYQDLINRLLPSPAARGS